MTKSPKLYKTKKKKKRKKKRKKKKNEISHFRKIRVFTEREICKGKLERKLPDS